MVFVDRNIFLLKNTGTWTYSNIIIHTWNRLPCLISYFYFSLHHIETDTAISYTKNFSQIPNWCLNSSRKWSEIFRSITETLSSLDELRNWWFCNLDIRKILIIFHEDIVFWRKMLDEVGFKNKRFNFSITRNPLNSANFCHHLLLCNRKLISTEKIRIHPIFEILRFSNIDYLIFIIFHLIYPRTRWKMGKNIHKMLWSSFFHNKNCMKKGEKSKNFDYTVLAHIM